MSSARPLPSRRGGTARVPALDGVRGVAIACVVLYHVAWGVHPRVLGGWNMDDSPRRGLLGGWLGVDIFFALSGFLITGLLLREHAETGRLDFRRFYRHRLLRLGPAMVLFVVGLWALSETLPLVAPYLATWFPKAPSSQRFMDVFGVLTFSTNWMGLLGIPGTQAFGGMWSLAIEEQFYLVWPVLLLATRRASIRCTAWVALGGTVASIAACWYLAPHDPYQQRVYFGTDTRAQGLLLGALAALAVHHGRLPSRRVLAWLAVGGLAVLAEVGLLVADDDPIRIRGAVTAADLATAAILVFVVSYDSPLSRALSAEPLRWLGRRSYAIYLWSVGFSAVSIGSGWVRPWLSVPLSLLLGELSWRLVEQPVARWRRRQAPSRVRSSESVVFDDLPGGARTSSPTPTAPTTLS